MAPVWLGREGGGVRGQGASGGEAGGLHSGTTHPLQQRNGHHNNKSAKIKLYLLFLLE